MGLRLAEGIAFDTFATRTGLGLLDCIDPEILAAALDEAYLVQTPTHLIATPEGRKRLDALLPALVL
jgi:oxygen-independent coproporphyrinogen-3 oxidase